MSLSALLLLAGVLGCKAEAADDPPAATDNSSEGLTWPEGESRGMQHILDALKTQERALDRREKSIEAREAELRRVEEELEGRLTELETLRVEIEALLDEGDEERQRRVRALVKMTESMRSAQAAALLSELDPDLAVEVLDEMNPAKAGKALASMDPPRAARLAEDLTLPTLQRTP